MIIYFTLVAPKIISVTKDKIVNLNIHSQTILTCKAQGVPAPKIIWTKEGNDTVLPSSGGTLTLTNLEPRDIGKYKCTAFNSEGNVTKSVHLLLHCKYIYFAVHFVQSDFVQDDFNTDFY